MRSPLFDKAWREEQAHHYGDVWDTVQSMGAAAVTAGVVTGGAALVAFTVPGGPWIAAALVLAVAGGVWWLVSHLPEVASTADAGLDVFEEPLSVVPEVTT